MSPARVFGRLFDLGAYPALIPSPDPTDRVYGELLELLNPERSLDWLDGYEGPEYMRVLLRVQLAETERQAWSFVSKMPVSEASRIPSGRWLRD